jgi:alpha-tubulin suppressor-like RCC1 family protein
VPGVDEFSSVKTSIFHSCGLDVAGHPWCWGRNEEGQIGVAQSLTEPTTQLTSDPQVHIAVGRFHSCVMDAAASVRCTGANDRGQLGLGDTSRRFSLTLVPL